MKILLIAPASGNWRSVGTGRWFNGKTFRFSLLSLSTVAALTPPEHSVTIVDEQIQDVPWEADVDLVGITCMTAAAPRAYEIARHFRSRGVPVVLGGMHPTLCSEEALHHADAVVAGEAQGVWERVLDDARHGALHGLYRNTRMGSGMVIHPAITLLERGRYLTLNAIEATRGCPKGCAFCAVSAYHQRQHKKYRVDDVIERIKNTQGRFLIFVDDHLTADLEYARELFERMVPLRKRWVSQMTLEAAQDEGFVQLMRDSGCVGVFVGMETFNADNLDAVHKGFHRVEQYREAVKVFHRNGIGVEAGIVFGFDQDEPEVFEETLHQLEIFEVDAVQFSILTPLPGTPFYESMQHRILDRYWGHYDFHHAVFEPKRMSVESLQAGHDWITREFYRPWRIARRMSRCVQRPQGARVIPYLSTINLAYLGRVLRWHINGWNPAGKRIASTILRPNASMDAFQECP